MKACHQAKQNVMLLKSKDFRDLGAVHMSRASPANRADSILLRPMVA